MEIHSQVDVYKLVLFTTLEIIQQIYVLEIVHQDLLLITKQESVLKNVLKIKEFMEIQFFMFVLLHVQEDYLEVKSINNVLTFAMMVIGEII